MLLQTLWFQPSLPVYRIQFMFEAQCRPDVVRKVAYFVYLTCYAQLLKQGKCLLINGSVSKCHEFDHGCLRLWAVSVHLNTLSARLSRDCVVEQSKVKHWRQWRRDSGIVSQVYITCEYIKINSSSVLPTYAARHFYTAKVQNRNRIYVQRKFNVCLCGSCNMWLSAKTEK